MFKKKPGHEAPGMKQKSGASHPALSSLNAFIYAGLWHF